MFSPFMFVHGLGRYVLVFVVRLAVAVWGRRRGDEA